jgi:hypothetical protein
MSLGQRHETAKPEVLSDLFKIENEKRAYVREYKLEFHIGEPE